MRLQPDHSGVGMTAHYQDPRDAVRLSAGELPADSPRGLPVAKDLCEAIEGVLENAAIVAAGTKHAS
jgi:hypothetical protein